MTSNRLETLSPGREKKKKGNGTERKVNKEMGRQVRLMVEYESSIDEISSLLTKRARLIISVNFRMDKIATTVD